MTRPLLVLLVLLCASPASADEPNPLRWPSHRPIADWLSTGAVGVQIGLAVKDAWQQPDRKHALGCLALENGLGIGVNELLKRVTHRRRPDGSDFLSFPSEHTMLSTLNARRGWRYGISVGVGYGRMAADKHHVSDVGVGAALGWTAGRICR